MNNTTIERLEALIEVLMCVPKQKFNLRDWRRRKTSAESVSPYCVSSDELMDIQCNTAGCAVGWACASPKFQQMGLEWEYEAPKFGKQHGWEAVGDFFGITHSQASRLFDALEYSQPNPGPAQVAVRVNKLITDLKREAARASSQP